jgi:hypothetical protein
MKSEDLLGIIRRRIIFWDLALCSVAEVRLSATYQTVRYSVPEDRQSSKDNASRGKRYSSFKFTHAHIIYVYAVPMC